jgi:hypothetical protein
VTEASALSAPDSDRRRADFTAAEMASGEDLFFAQSDNRSSKEVLYRLRVLEMRPRARDPDRERERRAPVAAALI